MPGRPAASMEKGSVRVRHVRLDLRDGGGEMPSGYARLREHLERHSIPLTLLDGEGALPPEEVDGPPPHKGLDAAECLDIVLHPSEARLKAAKTSGVQTVGVLSKGKADQAAAAHADIVVSSLLDLQLERFQLPSFTDWCGEVLPIPPLLWKGQVVKGFGRGSKVLGIPTANLDAKAVGALAEGVAAGIYIGWASVGTSTQVYKMVMSVGFNPFFDNAVKTVEPWLLHDFPADFYGEELRLVVNAYIRPEATFTTLENLVARIHQDADIARAALNTEPLAAHRQHPFLLTTPRKTLVWDEIPAQC